MKFGHNLLIGMLFTLVVGWAIAGSARGDPVKDWVPPHGKIVFWWTQEGAALSDPVEQPNDTDNWVLENFGEPPAEATDWRQWTEDQNGKRSDVMGGNIKQNSPWTWHLLSELPSVQWRIPDMIAVDPPLTTLYAAVNLDLYFSTNPWPALEPGMDVFISEGRLSGLEGIYWSDKEFVFDENSETGFVPDPAQSGIFFTGAAVVQNFHTPEPSTLALLLVMGVGVLRRRR